VAVLLLPYQPLLHVPGRLRDTSASRSYVTCPLPPHLNQFPRWVLVIVGQFAGFAGGPALYVYASAAAPGPSSAPPPAAVIAASALALPICQSSTAPTAHAAAKSTGVGGLIPAAAAASEDPATSSVTASCSAPSRSTSAAGPCVVAPGDAAAQRRPRLRNLVFTVDGDGNVQTHDGPVDKAELATVSTTLLGSTRRNPEITRRVSFSRPPPSRGIGSK